MFERLEETYSVYLDLERQLAEVQDVKTMTKLSKQFSKLKPIVETYLAYKDLNTQLKELTEIEDPSMLELIHEEKVELSEKIKALEEKLKVLLLPKDPDDDKNVIVEIKGATGGDEANIFAGDLFRMYQRFADSKGWKIEVLNSSPGTQGGFSAIEFMVKGENAFSVLKYESGVHRVQRVPKTESMGRVHTSTSTVYVTPEAEEIDFNLPWEEIRVDYFCSSGPGGQSVNTTKSAVRLTHIPTNTVVSCQDGKSQHENKDSAYIVLKSRLYDQMMQEKAGKEGELRRELVGRGQRSEKIRTYNYPQNRVTDHRIGLTLQRLDSIIDGNVALIIDPLLQEFERRALAENKD